MGVRVRTGIVRSIFNHTHHRAQPTHPRTHHRQRRQVPLPPDQVVLRQPDKHPVVLPRHPVQQRLLLLPLAPEPPRTRIPARPARGRERRREGEAARGRGRAHAAEGGGVGAGGVGLAVAVLSVGRVEVGRGPVPVDADVGLEGVLRLDGAVGVVVPADVAALFGLAVGV